MNKEIRKNREALIRHFYSLPEPDRNKYSSKNLENYWSFLCAKGQCVKLFIGQDSKNDPSYFEYHENEKTIRDLIAIEECQWREMEMLFDWHDYSFPQIADWLQTLPGWPKVL